MHFFFVSVCALSSIFVFWFVRPLVQRISCPCRRRSFGSRVTSVLSVSLVAETSTTQTRGGFSCMLLTPPVLLCTHKHTQTRRKICLPDTPPPSPPQGNQVLINGRSMANKSHKQTMKKLCVHLLPRSLPPCFCSTQKRKTQGNKNSVRPRTRHARKRQTRKAKKLGERTAHRHHGGAQGAETSFAVCHPVRYVSWSVCVFVSRPWARTRTRTPMFGASTLSGCRVLHLLDVAGGVLSRHDVGNAVVN